jgi:peptidoglycan/LPS O-acetylase OafA/YrhL
LAETTVTSAAGKPSFLSLRRITTSGNYIPEIDGLRFAAILSVVFFHVPVQISLHGAEINRFWYVVSHGNRGVQLFFAISGFILGLPFAAHLLQARKAVRLRDYFLRRVTRLEPPYIVAILIRLPLLLLVMHKPLRYVTEHGVASLFYLHSLIFGTMSVVNPPAWSLEVEIQFYCLAPLLAWSYFRLRPAWLRRTLGIAFILGAGIVQSALPAFSGERYLTLTILNYVQYFFAGFILCDLYLTDWNRIPEHWSWDLISAAVWCWIFLSGASAMHILLPLATLVVYIGAFKGRVFRAFFRTPWVSIIGGMCYSIYLTHNLAITGVSYLLHRWLASPSIGNVAKSLIAYTAVLPSVLLVGLLLYVLIERPCMDKNWPSKLMLRLRGRQRVLAEERQPTTT